MGRAKPDPYKQKLANISPPPEHRISPKDPGIYLSTSPWQIMSYDYELQAKRELLADLFRDLSDTPIHPVITDGKDYFYRNKMEYALYWDNSTQDIKLAFHQRNSHRKIPISQSSIERPEIFAEATRILNELNARHAQARDYQSLMIRCDQQGTVASALFENHKPHPIMPLLSDTLLEQKYTYSPNGFFQINLPVYELALREISRHITTNQVLDLYSGVGTIGLSVARDKHLTLVETNPSAYEELVKNCTLVADLPSSFSENLSPARTATYIPDVTDKVAVAESRLQSLPADQHMRSPAKAGFEEKGARKSAPNPVLAKSEEATSYITPSTTVILDPPRAGLDPKLTSALLDITPPTIIYLSCNPATQARDIRLLADKYQITSLQPFNFFPRTPHIENLAILTKKP